MKRTLAIVWTFLGVVGCAHPREQGRISLPLAWRLAVGKHADPPPWGRR